MSQTLIEKSAAILEEIDAAGTRKRERLIVTPQSTQVTTRLAGDETREVLNFCATIIWAGRRRETD